MAKASAVLSWDDIEHRDTVYVTVVDRDLNAVSLINSSLYPFGSGVYAKKSGGLRNRGWSFRAAPGPPEFAGVAQTSDAYHHSRDADEGDHAVMRFGVMGGHYQACGYANFLANALDRGIDIQAAAEAPRSFAFDGLLELEATIPEMIKDDLSARGHRVKWVDAGIGAWSDAGLGDVRSWRKADIAC
jgi:gamma-glutamyltranspeptidase / glutathione hydrolase